MTGAPSVCEIPAVDLRFNEDQERFRSEVCGWLEQNTPSPVFGRAALRSLDTAEGFEQHRAWEKKMFGARLSVVSWPVEYGGRGMGLWDWIVFEEEYDPARAPIRVGQNGIFLLAPAIFEFGTPEQKARFLPPMASGEEIWCQGWSEPDAGSDLAGIRSSARRNPADDGWILSGQKTWCSRGAFADWIFGLFRSDPQSERHRGLTYFLVPLSSSGITVRPIPQIDRETGFAEVFFDDVRVPDEHALGRPGDGWKVAMSTAGSERGMSLRSPARYTVAANRLVSLYLDSLKVERRAEDVARAGRLGEDVARAWTAAEAYRLYTYWTATSMAAGNSVGAEASVGKIHWSETDLFIQKTAVELLGPTAFELGADARVGGASSGVGSVAPDADDAEDWLEGFRFSLAGTIYAGTNEIQRNVVAERLLGLPRSNFGFDEQQLEFRSQLRAVLDRECTPADLRDAFEGAISGAPPDRGRWTRLAAMGVVGLTVPEADGGLGLGFVDLVGLLEEAGRAGVPEPLVETTAVVVNVLAAVLGSGSSEGASGAARDIARDTARDCLSRVASGDVLATILTPSPSPRSLGGWRRPVWFWPDPTGSWSPLRPTSLRPRLDASTPPEGSGPWTRRSTRRRGPFWRRAGRPKAHTPLSDVPEPWQQQPFCSV